MDTKYLEIEIKVPEHDQELLIAWLSELGFDSFWQKEDTLSAFILNDQFTHEVESSLKRFVDKLNTTYEQKVLEDKNWNAEWEQNFQAVSIEDYCYIRADFHEELPGFKHSIVINPKMSFGTAHHETTFMMIRMMESISLTKKKVVDFGCGTGILAILAALEEADPVIAFDYDENAVLNSQENFNINNVNEINLFMGGIGDMGNQTEVDIVLANINRQVLLDSRDQIYTALNKDGQLLMSGILETDFDLIYDHYCQQAAFRLIRQMKKGDWMCLHFEIST